MAKLVSCVLLLLVATAMAATNETSKGSEKMKASAVKDLSLDKFVGQWFEVGASGVIEKAFLKDCKCNEINFDKSGNDLQLTARCLNKTDNKPIVAKALSKPVDPKLPSAFNLDFQQENATKISEEKKQAVVKATEAGNATTGAGNATTGAGNATAAYMVLHIDKEYKHAIIGAPKLDAVWILSRTRNMDDKKYQELVKFANDQGFSATNIKKTDQSKCEELVGQPIGKTAGALKEKTHTKEKEKITKDK